MSSFDELDQRFGVGKKLREAMVRRLGHAAGIEFSVRWWPRRDAPTSAFACVYPPSHGAPSTAKRSAAVWFIITRDVVEEPTIGLLPRAIEYMSPIPHTAVMSVVDAYEFFQLGRALREQPSKLATDFAEVWHAPHVADGRLVFFAFSEGDMRFRRVSIDLEAARVDETLL